MDKNYIYFLYDRKLKYLYKNNHELLYDKDFIRRIITKNNKNITYVPSKVLEDEDFFLEIFIIIYNNKKFLATYELFILYDKMSHSMKENIHFLMKLILINYCFFQILIEKKCFTKRLIIKVIKLFPHFIGILPKKYKNNKELVSTVFKFRTTNIFKRPIYISNLSNDLRNDLNIKFKVFNLLLKTGNLDDGYYLHHKYKRFDPFEFFKKENEFLFNFKIKNVKLINHLILRNSNYQILKLLTKNCNKNNIIEYLSNYNFYKYFKNKNIFFKVFNFFDNKGDIIIHLLKYNVNFLCIIIKDETLMDNKHMLKILIKNNYSYKYDTSNYDNINVIVNKSISFNFSINDNFRSHKKYKNKKIFFSKKIINKLLYYNDLEKNKLLYNRLPFNFFKNFDLMINHLPIFTNFIKINHRNFINYDYYFFKTYYIEHNKQTLLHFIKNGCKILKYLDKEFQNDVEIVYYSLKLNIKQIKHANIRFINEFVNQNFNLEKTFEIFHLIK